MTIRFVMEAPGSNSKSLIAMLDDLPDTEPLGARESEHYNPGTARRVEISVIAQSLDVVDALYAWLEAEDHPSPVYINVDRGDRYSLAAYDAPSLRQAIAGDQEHAPEPKTMRPALHQRPSRAGNGTWEVAYGGKMTTGPALVPASTNITLGGIDHIALRVRDMARAERFYQTFFGMDIMYRAYRVDDRWEQLDESFDWNESIQTGIRPEIVRLENGPVALLLVDIGGGKVVYEKRIDHFSVTVSPETLAELRGRAFFHSFTTQEDIPAAFRFVDPYGMVWQLIADESLSTTTE